MNTGSAHIDPVAREVARARQENSRRAREDPPDLFGWNRPVNQFNRFQVFRACINALIQVDSFPLAGRRIADIGCGRGRWLLEFVQWEARPEDLAGIDIEEASVATARRRLPEADLHVGDATRLPWGDQCFDIVSQFTVFTSILDPGVRRLVASEMLRVLRPGGFILWYDFLFNNPSNPQVRAVKAAEIAELFPRCDVRMKRVTLAPPLARRVVPVSWVAALLLEKVPLLRTHCLGIIRKPQ